MAATASFKELNAFDARCAESRRICEKFPGRVPVIVERATRAAGDIPPLDKCKFLVPMDLTVGQFIYVIRKRMAMPPEKALFLFVGSVLPMTGTLMRELYGIHRDADGFLYMQYTGENTFG